MPRRDLHSDAPTAHHRPSFGEMCAAPHRLVALSLGLGLAPFAPGTFGSLGGLPLHLALAPLPIPLRVVAYAALLVLGTRAVGRTGRDFGEHDHGALVFDETLATALTLEFAPATMPGWIAAFSLFRLFDVWKPWPVNIPDERGSGGFSVMLDDLLAAVWAVICLRTAVAVGLLAAG